MKMLIKWYKKKLKYKSKVFELFFDVKSFVFCALLKIKNSITYNVLLYKKF